MGKIYHLLMGTHIRLGKRSMVGVLLLLLVGAAFHLKISSRLIQQAKERQPLLGPRIPVHPSDPEMTPDHPSHREMVRILDRIRAMEAEAEVPLEWIERLNNLALALLYELESLALDMGEDTRIRCILLQVLSRFREEAMRQFFVRLFADPREDLPVREKALDLLSDYLELDVYRERTRQVLLRALEVESNAEFQDRIRQVVSRVSK
jgi:hypothetical protein